MLTLQQPRYANVMHGVPYERIKALVLAREPLRLSCALMTEALPEFEQACWDLLESMCCAWKPSDRKRFAEIDPELERHAQRGSRKSSKIFGLLM